MSKRTVKDQLGRTIELSDFPQRIVSIVPSQTELLYHLGLNSEVVGITKFCVHPEEWHREKLRVGGTKQLHLKKIRDLNPDLILANKEENESSQIQALSSEFPVWVSDIRDLESAFDMIRQVGEIVGKAQTSIQMITDIRESRARFRMHNMRRAAYFIWNDPFMSVNGDTFIHCMMEEAGFANVFEHRTESRYPEISDEMLKEASPEFILLSSEPFPFEARHISAFRKILPDAKILLVDGEMFSWYGPRMKDAFRYFPSLA